jgi:hypothetical protein
MSTSRYRGFKVVARPYQLFASRRWISDLEIRRDGRSQAFGVDAHYANELDADAGSVRAGREIIDSRLAEISVEHMRRDSLVSMPSVPAPTAPAFGSFILAGVVLLTVGAFVLFLGDPSTAQPEVFQVSEVQLTAGLRPTTAPWMGVVSLVVGAGLIATGLGRRPG